MLNVDYLAMTCNLPNYLGCYSGAGMLDERVLLTRDWSISGIQLSFSSKFPPYSSSPYFFTPLTLGPQNCHHSLTIIFSPDLKVICDWKSWNENRILKNFVLRWLILEPDKPIKFLKDPKYLPFKLKTSSFVSC